MRIAITGANGLVGKTLTRYCLERGHYVVKIDLPGTTSENQPNSEFRAIDVATDYPALKDAFHGADAIIHLAAIPSPSGPENDYRIYAINSNASFNALHAAASSGIKRICQASSVNALGLVYSQRPLAFDSFPIKEDDKPRVCDAYALSKQVCEVQAESMVYWFPGTRIASMRFHHVNPLEVCRKRIESTAKFGPLELWGWVSPEATARACLLSIEAGDFSGHEAFNIVAPTTIYSDVKSADLARQHYPDTQDVKLEENQGFWDTNKAQRLLGWDHHETE